MKFVAHERFQYVLLKKFGKSDNKWCLRPLTTLTLTYTGPNLVCVYELLNMESKNNISRNIGFGCPNMCPEKDHRLGVICLALVGHIFAATFDDLSGQINIFTS